MVVPQCDIRGAWLYIAKGILSQWPARLYRATFLTNHEGEPSDHTTVHSSSSSGIIRASR